MSPEQLLAIRRIIGADLSVSQHEAEALFRLNEKVSTPEDWAGYFITVITNFLIYETKPEGYVSDINAAWLKARIEHDGVVDTEVELALLLNLIKQAHNITDSLEKFALDQVTLAIINSKGYLRSGQQLTPGIIGQAEIGLLKQILYGASSEGGISISRMEAEYLVELNEAITGKDHHPDWQKLFVLALTNHLMMSAAWEEPNAQEALRLQTWLEDTKGPQIDWGISNILNGLDDILAGKFGKPNTFKHMDEKANVEAEKITELEADWLIKRLNRDGGIDANEQALLDHLAQECPDIHESLKPYLKAA